MSFSKNLSMIVGAKWLHYARKIKMLIVSEWKFGRNVFFKKNETSAEWGRFDPILIFCVIIG